MEDDLSPTTSPPNSTLIEDLASGKNETSKSPVSSRKSSNGHSRDSSFTSSMFESKVDTALPTLNNTNNNNLSALRTSVDVYLPISQRNSLRKRHASREDWTTSVSKGEMIRLNVGGKIFCTSKTTLTRIPNTFFSALLSGEISSLKDETGAFFIDREGSWFEPILNYLRTENLIIPPNIPRSAILQVTFVPKKGIW